MSESLGSVPLSEKERMAAQEIAKIHEANEQLRTSESLIKPPVRFAEGTQTRIRADRPLKPLDKNFANSFADLSDVDVSTLSPDDKRYFSLDRDDLVTGDRILQTSEEGIPDGITEDEGKGWDRAIKAAKLKIEQEGVIPIKTKAELQLEKDKKDMTALRAKVRQVKNDWEKEEYDHAVEARDKASQWQKDDTVHAADVERAKGVWRADNAAQLQSMGERLDRVARVENDIRNNPTGKLAKLRQRVRKSLRLE